MTTASNVTYTSPPPAYAEVTPAPKYTPKKDFSKAFGELQGQYGFGGGAPILSNKDEKPKPKPAAKSRTPSSSSTESTGKTSKKDFSKAFGELQGRYGYDGGAPILASKERTSSDSSTGSKKSIIGSIKNMISPKSPKDTKDTKDTKQPKPTRTTCVPLARIPSPARRTIESGPTLSFNASGWTYPLRCVSSGSSSSSGESDDAKREQRAARQARTDSAVRGVIAGVYGFDAGAATGRTAGA